MFFALSICWQLTRYATHCKYLRDRNTRQKCGKDVFWMHDMLDDFILIWRTRSLLIVQQIIFLPFKAIAIAYSTCTTTIHDNIECVRSCQTSLFLNLLNSASNLWHERSRSIFRRKRTNFNGRSGPHLCSPLQRKEERILSRCNNCVFHISQGFFL